MWLNLITHRKKKKVVFQKKSFLLCFSPERANEIVACFPAGRSNVTKGSCCKEVLMPLVKYLIKNYGSWSLFYIDCCGCLISSRKLLQEDVALQFAD